MTTNKKYDFIIEQAQSLWVAKVTRKITSKKTVVTKQKDDFTTEEQAIEWAKLTLEELSKTLKASNSRHGAQRKNLEEIRRQRSNRRSEKTELANAQKAKELAELEQAQSDEDSE